MKPKLPNEANVVTSLPSETEMRRRVPPSPVEKGITGTFTKFEDGVNHKNVTNPNSNKPAEGPVPPDLDTFKLSIPKK